MTNTNSQLLQPLLTSFRTAPLASCGIEKERSLAVRYDVLALEFGTGGFLTYHRAA